jgi:hypothetical protein
MTDRRPHSLRLSNDLDFSGIFVNQLKLMGQFADMARGSVTNRRILFTLSTLLEKDMMTIAFSWKDGGHFPEVADYSFVVPSFSIRRIQERARNNGAHLVGSDSLGIGWRGRHLKWERKSRIRLTISTRS